MPFLIRLWIHQIHSKVSPNPMFVPIHAFCKCFDPSTSTELIRSQGWAELENAFVALEAERDGDLAGFWGSVRVNCKVIG